MDVNDNFKALIKDYNEDNMPEELKELFFGINQLVAYEYLSGNEQLSFMISDINDTFDIEKAYEY
jgi:hypothetical protein